ncbi:MAG: hypothetical protein R2769_17335 [Saprospiraceae bacterium]
MSDADPSFTGFPTVDGQPLSTGNLCMLNVGYNDVVAFQLVVMQRKS